VLARRRHPDVIAERAGHRQHEPEIAPDPASTM